MDLYLWWQKQNDLAALVGEERYRDPLAELLSVRRGAVRLPQAHAQSPK
ncbi:hypothetical protein [Streptomyces sp. BF23-19]|nr:hypothetical protein OG253_34565 [Streptomyces virginiae]